MQQRLNGQPSRTATQGVPGLRPAARSAQTILGIDPSLRGTGYGVIRVGKGCLILLAQGTITCPARWERSRCLANIART